MIRDFRRAGAQVWICTTRPYLSLDNIEPDTRHWLRRNGIQYDGLLLGAHKYNDLVKQVDRDNILAVLDDLPEQCYAARTLGLQAYIRDQPFNRDNSDFPRVTGFDMQGPWRVSMMSFISRRVRECRQERG